MGRSKWRTHSTCVIPDQPQRYANGRGLAVVQRMPCLDCGGSSLERVEQEVGLGVTVWERPIFRKERRSGPFFTIVEVETDEVIGMETRVDTPRLLNELNQRRMGDAVVREVLQRIDNGAAASFQDSFKVGPTTYSLVYDKDAGNVRIRYLD